MRESAPLPRFNMPGWICRFLVSILALPTLAVTPVMADEALWSTLKAGGKVVLMRHAAIERGSGRPLHLMPGCDGEMRLSTAGQRQAEAVGKAFRQRKIPVGNVLASPYCRTMETARVAFGSAKPSTVLHLLESLDAREAARRTEEVTKLIGSYTGTANLVLVTHQPNVEAIALESVEPAGMLVLAPKGGSDFEVLGRLAAPKGE